MRTFLVLVLILGVAFLGFAYYREWLVFQTESHDEPGDESTSVKIKLNKSKAKDDVAKLKKSAKDTGKEVKESAKETADKVKKKVRELTASKTYDGEIVVVNPTKRQVTLQVKDDLHLFTVDNNTNVKRDGKEARLKALTVGDRATIKAKEKDGAKHATEVAALSKRE